MALYLPDVTLCLQFVAGAGGGQRLHHSVFDERRAVTLKHTVTVLHNQKNQEVKEPEKLHGAAELKDGNSLLLLKYCTYSKYSVEVLDAALYLYYVSQGHFRHIVKV